MSWNGPVSVGVANGTGSAITAVTAACTSRGETTSFGPVDVPAGGRVQFSIPDGQGPLSWSVSFVLGPTCYYGTERQCDVPGTGSQAIVLDLLPPDTGWKVEGTPCGTIPYRTRPADA